MQNAGGDPAVSDGLTGCTRPEKKQPAETTHARKSRSRVERQWQVFFSMAGQFSSFGCTVCETRPARPEVREVVQQHAARGHVRRQVAGLEQPTVKTSG